MSFEVTFTLTEQEARALHAIQVYGSKVFLETFYKHLGKSYLEDHEQGIKTLFEKLRDLEGPLTNISNVKKSWREGTNVPIR